MRFLILGRLEIRGEAGEPVVLRAPKPRALLAVLLLHANRPVNASLLEAALWPGKPPHSAAGVLRTYVAKLREALGLDQTGQIPRLAREPGGYRLVLAPGDLDLAVFDDLSARGHDALNRGDPAEAARLLSEALTLWRGDPVGDIALHGDSAAIVAALAERRLAAEEAWADAHLALGSSVGLIGRLRTLAADQPLRERVRGQLMLALYRAGRKTEALAEFGALHERMVAELGIEPSAPLRQLHRQILADDPALTASARTVIPRQLPPVTSDFTGRAAELSQLRALLSRPEAPAPIIAVITGPAGAGKTALAMHFAHEVADRFPHGQLFVNLRGHADAAPLSPGESLRRLLRALGAAPEQVPADQEEATALYRSLLAGKRMIVVLDNAGSAGQLRPLLPGAAGCLVVVTSRSRLPGLLARSGATPVSLGPLSEAEAVSLLRKLLGDRRVDAEPAAAAQIAARCAFLPLAVRIAAERAAHRPRLPLAGLAGELAAARDRLDALTAGPDSDTTVRSVFSWSYHGLPSAAARMFRLLGLHPAADISIPAAAALAGVTPAAAGRLLETLAEVHLLEETGPGRYRLHDLLRAYAAERATTDETPHDHAAAVRRMLTWCLHTADAADAVLMPGRRHLSLGAPPRYCEPVDFAGYEQALAWCDAEHATLAGAVRQAAEAGYDDVAWQLTLTMGSYFELRKPWTEWIACGRIGLAAAVRAGNRRAESWMLNGLACVHSDLRRYDDALDCLQRALVIVREIGNRKGQVATTCNIGWINLLRGRLAEAFAFFSLSLHIARDIGERYGEGITLGSLGEVYQRMGQTAAALDCYQRAVTLARETGDLRTEGESLNNLAGAYRAIRQPGQAVDCYEQSLAVRRRAGDRQGQAQTLRDFGDFLHDSDQPERAAQCWQQALAIFTDLGDAQADEVRRRLLAPVPAPTPAAEQTG